MKAGPLDGVRVVEITMFQQGPVAGMRLGDMGADVIKVEAKNGDPARGMMQIIEAQTGLKGHNYYYEHCNRNKRNIVIDLKTKEGMEIFLKLIDTADVFINNMSIKAPAKMGIGPDVLMKRNPRLIYAHASGWGREGPDAHDLSFDYTGIARCGFMMSCGERGAPPSQILPGIGDEVGGLMCAWGVCAALYSREKTGKGQLVDTSLMGSLMTMIAFILAAPAILGAEFSREIRAEAGNPLYNHYRCSDDKWIALAHLDPNTYWPKVCKALGMEDLVNDPKFNSIEARGKNAAELIRIIDARIASKTRAEWLTILKDEGCIFSPIQSPIEVTKDAQAFANNYMINIQHPTAGPMKMVGWPWNFSETPASWRRPAPEFGEHTEEILEEVGYTKDAIAQLKEAGVVIAK